MINLREHKRSSDSLRRIWAPCLDSYLLSRSATETMARDLEFLRSGCWFSFMGSSAFKSEFDLLFFDAVLLTFVEDWFIVEANRVRASKWFLCVETMSSHSCDLKLLSVSGPKGDILTSFTRISHLLYTIKKKIQSNAKNTTPVMSKKLFRLFIRDSLFT